MEGTTCLYPSMAFVATGAFLTKQMCNPLSPEYLFLFVYAGPSPPPPWCVGHAPPPPRNFQPLPRATPPSGDLGAVRESTLLAQSTAEAHDPIHLNFLLFRAAVVCLGPARLGAQASRRRSGGLTENPLWVDGCCVILVQKPLEDMELLEVAQLQLRGAQLR